MVLIGPYNIELVPAGSWAKTLSQLAREHGEFRPRWEQIRRRELERANYKCEICGADGLLECSERWSYDDSTHLQKLIGYDVLCPACHSILHIDRTIQVGGLEKALSQFIRVTGFTEEDLKTASANALKTWRARSRYQWRLDMRSEPLAFGFEGALSGGTRPGRLSASSSQRRVASKTLTNKPYRERALLSPQEVRYLTTQRLARIATSSKRGVPEVSPVAFEFDGASFWVGSHDQSIFFKTQRYRNISGGNDRVSLVIDDLQSVDPWRPRGLKVSGTAEIADHDGLFGRGKYFRITPRTTVSWGIDRLKKGQPVSEKTLH